MANGYSYLTVEECLDTFSKMERTDKARLLMNCKDICNYYELSMSPHDLINEMLMRVMSGSRHVPYGDNFLMSISWICKSIAEGIFSSAANRQQRIENTVYDTALDECSGGFIDEESSSDFDNKLEKVIDYFKLDIPVTNLINAILDDLKPKEIIAITFDGDKKAYDAARKRFSRAIPKIKKEVA